MLFASFDGFRHGVEFTWHSMTPGLKWLGIALFIAIIGKFFEPAQATTPAEAAARMHSPRFTISGVIFIVSAIAAMFSFFHFMAIPVWYGILTGAFLVWIAGAFVDPNMPNRALGRTSGSFLLGRLFLGITIALLVVVILKVMPDGYRFLAILALLLLGAWAIARLLPGGMVPGAMLLGLLAAGSLLLLLAVLVPTGSTVGLWGGPGFHLGEPHRPVPVAQPSGNGGPQASASQSHKPTPPTTTTPATTPSQPTKPSGQTIQAVLPKHGRNPQRQGAFGRGSCFPHDDRIHATTGTEAQDKLIALIKEYHCELAYKKFLVDHRDYSGIQATSVGSGETVAHYIRRTTCEPAPNDTTVLNFFFSDQEWKPWQVQTFPAGEWLCYVPGFEPADQSGSGVERELVRPIFKVICGNVLLKHLAKAIAAVKPSPAPAVTPAPAPKPIPVARQVPPPKPKPAPPAHKRPPPVRKPPPPAHHKPPGMKNGSQTSQPTVTPTDNPGADPTPNGGQADPGANQCYDQNADPVPC